MQLGDTITAVKATQNPTQLLIKLNLLIANCTRSHQNSKAFHLFTQIHSSHHLKPDHYTLASTITACANLRNTAAGTQLHAHAVRAGFKAYVEISNTLLSLYAKSNDLNSTKKVFDEIISPDAYSWTTLLSAYTKFGEIDRARQLFDQMPQRNVAVWNAMITGCVELGCRNTAFEMFCRMHRLGIRHDRYSFASVLSLCSSPELLFLGKQVHSMIIRTGFVFNVSVINAQLTMYFNCGTIREAYDIFEEAMILNQITFNAMIAGLVSQGQDFEALVMFREMREACFEPTELTLVSVLSACSAASMVRLGGQVHALAIKTGFEACGLVSNAAITMYSSCGDLISSQLVFERLEEKDLVSWNSMITGHVQANRYEEAVAVFLQMQRAGIQPDEFTFGSLLARSEFQENAELIQALVTKNGLILKTQVCNALISAFAKCGKMEHAYKIFGEMHPRNLISWNSIISGFVLNGSPVKGLELFNKLQNSELKPNFYTLSISLSACTSISALRHGKQLHAYILRSGSGFETSLGNALVTMYAKCGDLDWSFKVFNGMNERDVVSWNSMVTAYAQHGEGKGAIRCFEAMRESGVGPDSVTFTALISACSHAGLVDEGRWIFDSMVKEYGIEPGADHYSCIVDLLGRAGYLDEAERLINSMSIQVDSLVWWALLSASRAHGNVRLGRVAAGFLLGIEPQNPAIYVLLSNINAAAGQWEEAASVRELMRKNGVMKKPGFSWIESENHVQW